ncbi:MAG: phosphatidylcholine/phosphatidylserine synthase [Opitutales bacterium]|nr:phosphatidylcholine/phosphatidylserine synthase [Opitutales bacterium]
MENNDRPQEPLYANVQDAARIYLLPNFFTAGNMFCGFMSLCTCIKAKFATDSLAAANELYMIAVLFIFGACIFDLFDGRVARTFKKTSMFGAEFDSIADTVSFGVAPAFLVYFLIFDPARVGNEFLSGILEKVGPAVGFVYLLCAGIRLAKFNVLTNPLVPGNEKKSPASDFMGISSPIAAAIVASFVVLLTSLDPEGSRDYLPFVLLPVMLVVSIMMVTNIPYPTFKHIDWTTKTKAGAFIVFIVAAILLIISWKIAVPVLLCTYVAYGLVRALVRKFKKTPLSEDSDAIEETF